MSDGAGRWWLPGVIALLPTGGIAWAEVDALEQRPLLLILMMLGWAVVTYVVGIVTALFERWKPGIVDWCDKRVMSHWNKSEHSYREWVIYRNRDFDVKGLSTQGNFSLELDRLYVDLRLMPESLHCPRMNPVAPATESAKDTSSELELPDAVHEYSRLAILGPPGCGKTTLLRYAALQLAGPPSVRADSGLPGEVPVLLFLRDIAPQLNGPNGLPTLADLIGTGTPGLNLDRDWMARTLADRKCILMLDGLDEVADPQLRATVVRWIEQQVVSYPGNRWVVTARPLGYQSNPVEGFTALSVQPLRHRQIRRFLEKWYFANEKMASQKEDAGIAMKAQEGAEDLLLRIDRSPDLVRLAVNPLLLTLIANVHRWRSSLPGRRVELYAEICDVFLGKRQEARGLTSQLRPQQKKLVLQTLAWHLMTTRRRELPEDEAAGVIHEVIGRVSPGTLATDFFREVQAGSGLLLEREVGAWEFAHKTFQEYLAALYAQEQRLGEELQRYVADGWWHETIRLYAALGDASGIIGAAIRGTPPTLTALVLAVQCEDEAREVAPDVRAALRSLVDAELDAEIPERRKLAAECRLEIRLRGLERISEGVFADFALMTNAEYQLFVSSEAEAGRARQPDHWQGTSFPQGDARAPALGVRGVDALAFCRWLTDRDGGDWRFRLPEKEEFLRLNEEKVDPLSGYWYGDGQNNLMCWSSGAKDDMPKVLDRFEQVIRADLDRLREFDPQRRVELGVNLSEAEVDDLLRFQAWLEPGSLRAGFRSMERFIAECSSRWWWRLVEQVLRTAGMVFRLALSVMRAIAKPFRWIRSHIPNRRDTLDSNSTVRSNSDEGIESIQKIVRLLEWGLRPLNWMIGRFTRRWISRILSEERCRMEASGGLPTPWSPVSLATLLERPGADDETKARWTSDFLALLLMQAIGQIVLFESIRVPCRGTSTLSVGRRADAPSALCKLSEALATRSWQTGSSQHASDPIDVAWATRVSLFLWWRQCWTEMFVAAVRKKEKGQAPTVTQPEFAILDAWFDAWAIGERAAGTTVPFEGIRIVKERRHAD